MQKNSFPQTSFKFLILNAKIHDYYKKLYEIITTEISWTTRRRSCLLRSRSYYVTFLLSERVAPSEVMKFAIVKIPLLQATSPTKISRYTWRDKTTPSFLSGWKTGGWSSAHAKAHTCTPYICIRACKPSRQTRVYALRAHVRAHTTYLHVYQRASERALACGHKSEEDVGRRRGTRVT